MDENEIQQIIEKATQEIKKNGQVSAQTAQELEKAGHSLDKFAKTIGSTGKATQQLLQGFLGFTRALAQGQRNIASMGSAVQGAGDAAATALGRSNRQGLAKAAGLASLAGSAVAAAFGALTKQLESFRSVGRVGALAADGLTGLQRQFVSSQLTLGQFEKLVGSNSKTLAAFQGTTYQGANEFSKALNQLTISDLQMLGMGAEDIADLAAGFLERQTKLGRVQNMDTVELRRTTKSYIKELDILSKLTGVSNDELQQQQLALLAENRFRAKYDQMYAEGRTKEADAMMSFVQSIQKYSPQLAAGVKDIFAAGTATTEAGGQAMLMGLGPIIDKLKTGQITDFTQALQQAQVPVGDFVKRYRGVTAMAGDSVSVLNDLAGSADFAKAKVGDLAEAAKTQAEQLKGYDKLTKDAVQAQMDIQKAGIALDELINETMPLIAVMAKGFAKALQFTVGTAKILVDSAEIVMDPDSYKFPTKEEQAEKKAITDERRAQGIKIPGEEYGLSDIFGLDKRADGGRIDKRADGGPVTAGEPYIIGEKGPELFWPKVAGDIIPHHLSMGPKSNPFGAKTVLSYADEREREAQVLEIGSQLGWDGNKGIVVLDQQRYDDINNFVHGAQSYSGPLTAPMMGNTAGPSMSRAESGANLANYLKTFETDTLQAKEQQINKELEAELLSDTPSKTIEDKDQDRALMAQQNSKLDQLVNLMSKSLRVQESTRSQLM